MKTISKIGFSLATAALLFFTGCNDNASPKNDGVKAMSEESIGLRKTDLYTENSTVADKTMYGKSAAGSGKKFDRAFENAPPMIPHDVDGMLPITIDNNQCIGCHTPDVAKSMGATPIPGSHFASMRPDTQIGANGEVIKEGKVIENTSDIKVVVKKLDTLHQGRFNCSQCHAPQSEGKLIVENNFKADFRDKDGISKSNFIDVLNDGVK